MSEKDDGTWMVQSNFKVGNDLHNVRGHSWNEFDANLASFKERIPELQAISKALQPQATYPIADVRAAPPPAQAPAPQPAFSIPGEVMTGVTSALPKQSKQGRTFYEIVFTDGSKATTFDTEPFAIAQTAMTHNRMVAVLFKMKGDFRNIDSIRLLGAA